MACGSQLVTGWTAAGRLSLVELSFVARRSSILKVPDGSNEAGSILGPDWGRFWAQIGVDSGPGFRAWTVSSVQGGGFVENLLFCNVFGIQEGGFVEQNVFGIQEGGC